MVFIWSWEDATYLPSLHYLTYSGAHCNFVVEEAAAEAAADDDNGQSFEIRLNDSSTNGTYVNGKLVGKGKNVIIKVGR